jgi:hypothetical protein
MSQGDWDEKQQTAVQPNAFSTLHQIPAWDI